MKKNLLTAVMLVSFAMLSQAQQRGVGINTTRPAATLDVTANTTDNSMPDAVLVPRMTATQLIAKDNNSGTYGDAQNGALIYIISGAGSTTRTNKITSAGFYYFDSSTPEWKPVSNGGGTTTSVPTYRTVAGAAVVTLLPSDVGNVVLFSGGISGDIKLPAPDASMVGKKLTIIEISGISQNLLNQNTNYKTNTYSSIQQYGSEFITDGTNWYSLGGQ